VRIGDGCATVTGYRLPQPLVFGPGRRERGQALSQDIGPVVLVSAVGGEFFPTRQKPVCTGLSAANFSVKEKDEASQPRVCAVWVRWMPSFSDLPGQEVFPAAQGCQVPFPALVSQP